MSINLWAATSDGQIANYTKESGIWTTYEISTTSIFADPKSGSSLYYTDSEGSVIYADPSAGTSTTFPTKVSGGNPKTPAFQASMISVGALSTIWAIDFQGTWARFSTGDQSWDPYTGQQSYIFAGAINPGACYYIDENGGVNWRNVNENRDLTYPGLTATEVTANRCNPPYAIGSDSTLNSWDEDTSTWVNYPDVECQSIFADPHNACRCYFVAPDGTVSLYCTSAQSVVMTFPGITATQISTGDLCNRD